MRNLSQKIIFTLCFFMTNAWAEKLSFESLAPAEWMIAQYSQEFDELDAPPEDSDSFDSGLDSDESGSLDLDDEYEQPRRARRRRGRSVGDATSLLKSGDSERASEILFSKSKRSFSDSEGVRVKYLLGLSLMQMGFNQAAAFQFISIIKSGSGRFLSLSLEKLSLAASRLKDHSLIDYALSRMQERRFTSKNRDLLNYYNGEYLSRNQRHVAAAKSFSRVRRSSNYYFKAKYNEGVAWAAAKKERNALSAFKEVIRGNYHRGKTNPYLVSAKLAFARVFYQRKKWDRSIEAYRSIPKNSAYWHDALFEMTWAMLLSSRFRSALSNFHSLHSPYYENTYQPESLVLRAIVYLYICNYDEMEKVVQLFEKVYTPIHNKLKSYLRETKNSEVFFEDFNTYVSYWRKSKGTKKGFYRGDIPEVVGKNLMGDGELRRLYSYLLVLNKERGRYNAQSTSWRSSDVGDYVQRSIEKRIKTVRKKIGRRVKSLIIDRNDVLEEFVEQNSFLRFEMLNEKKRQLKKGKMSKKRTVDEKEERDFYVQNGYDFWPFKGEYWLDEIGNYHFLGVRGCGKP